jgi:hypothetical protein
LTEVMAAIMHHHDGMPITNAARCIIHFVLALSLSLPVSAMDKLVVYAQVDAVGQLG